jgi:putative ABC transport system permease protein
MARRDMRRHPLRTALTGLLVMIPVLGATFAAQLFSATGNHGEQLARQLMGGADALVEVTRFPDVRETYEADGQYLSIRPTRFTHNANGHRTPVKRPRSAVSLASLLPPGTRVISAPTDGGTELASGGNAGVLFVDLADPMTEGIAWVDQGRAPASPDEVALPRAMADELGMLDGSGSLRRHATLRLADGRALSVVGLGFATAWGTGDAAARMIAAPDSVLSHPAPHRFLVDLPGPATLALVRDLATHGVAMEPRDVVFHPRAWHAVPVMGPPVDPRQVAVAMMLFVLALAEVVLLVGSAFAVGSRRQVRDLGLLASSGGAPSDVRRVVLAQGALLGVGATAVGLAAGVGLFLLAGDALWYDVVRERIWSDAIAWGWLVGIGVLGSVTGLAAALLPAWSVGRLTPVTALSGRFPIRPGESRAHLPAFVLAGCGAMVLALTGFWTAAEYAPQHGRGYHPPSSSPVLLGCLGLLMLLAGVVWSAPYVVRRLAAVGRHLPLSARFAFRDAARHRFRTAAAGAALTVTVASGVFVGFVLQSVVTGTAARTRIPPQTVSVYLPTDPAAGEGPSPQQLHRVADTLGEVLGPVRKTVIWGVFPSGSGPGGAGEVGVPLGRSSYMNVSAVGGATLRRILGPGHDAAVQAFDAGGVVALDARMVRDGSVTVATITDPRHPVKRWTLPGVSVARLPAEHRGLAGAWISLSTAHDLGLSTAPMDIEVHTDHLVTNDDLTRLAVHGINAWSQDPQLGVVTWIRLGVLGLAGLLTLVVAGIAVALAAAEGRADTATMAAIGAGPWRRRGLGAMHGLFLGVVGGLLGVLVGLPSAASLLQADGLPGIAVPWLVIAAALLVVPLLGAAAGWVVTPTRLPLVRRTG